MRVALCLSGQLRNVLTTCKSIYNNIVVPNGADVFIHSWDETGDVATGIDTRRRYDIRSEHFEHVLKVFKPKSYVFEKPRRFEEYNNLLVPQAWINGVKEVNTSFSDEEARRHSIFTFCSMFYSIQKCNDLKNEYAREHGIEYDAVIRLRFDAIVKCPVSISELDLTKVYYHELGQPDDIISDWINVGNTHVMNVYSNVLTEIRSLNTLDEKSRSGPVSFRGAADCIWGPEHLIREIMHINNIDKKSHNFNIEIDYS